MKSSAALGMLAIGTPTKISSRKNVRRAHRLSSSQSLYFPSSDAAKDAAEKVFLYQYDH